MGVTSNTPDAPGTKRAEATPSPALPDGEPAIADAQGAGAGPREVGTEEDWTSMATGDPALWLKQ